LKFASHEEPITWPFAFISAVTLKTSPKKRAKVNHRHRVVVLPENRVCRGVVGGISNSGDLTGAIDDEGEVVHLALKAA
jgi:hypothetical protein